MPRPPPSPSPPLTSFPYTTGFDFPHASAGMEPSVIHAGLSTGFHGLPSLAALREQTAAMHAAAAPPRDRARRTTRRGPLQRTPRDSDAVDHLSRRPPTANPNRPRATPSDRYLRRSQARIREQHAADMDPTSSLLDDTPLSSPFAYASSNLRPRSPTVEINSERRSKRRKLDHVPATAEYTCFKYGHKGQVVPGRLRMEVVSCDGGENHKDSPPPPYKVQNVLRNDKSVYCSEGSQCHLLLKHIGEAPFALEKVVIRAPDFTAPIVEGLVFVGMSAEELLSGTAAYAVHYTLPSRLPSPTPSVNGEDEELLSLREAIDDPLIWQHSRPGVQQDMEERIERQGAQEDMEERIENLRIRSERLNAETANIISSLRTDSERRRILRQMVEHEDEIDGDNCDHGEDDSPAGVSAPTPPPFTITTISDEEESDSTEEQPTGAIMAERMRRESRWHPDSDDDVDDDMPPLVPLHYVSDGWRERRERLLQPISRMWLSESGPETLKPLARFFVAKNKSKITIRFHPAFSGKYILLKFWSTRLDGTVNIERLEFHGYSGPRCFPAMQPR